MFPRFLFGLLLRCPRETFTWNLHRLALSGVLFMCLSCVITVYFIFFDLAKRENVSKQFLYQILVSRRMRSPRQIPLALFLVGFFASQIFDQGILYTTKILPFVIRLFVSLEHSLAARARLRPALISFNSSHTCDVDSRLIKSLKSIYSAFMGRAKKEFDDDFHARGEKRR